MSGDHPTAEDLSQGTTVEIEPESRNVDATDDEPVVGDVARIYGDEPDGPRVELKTGVVGHVRTVLED